MKKHAVSDIVINQIEGRYYLNGVIPVLTIEKGLLDDYRLVVAGRFLDIKMGEFSHESWFIEYKDVTEVLNQAVMTLHVMVKGNAPVYVK